MHRAEPRRVPVAGTARRVAAALAAAVLSGGLAATPVAADSGPGVCERLIAYREGAPIASKIMGVPESGGTPRLIYDGPLSELDPDWSPNGRQLVFATRVNNAGVVSERGLDVVDVTTGKVRTVLRQDPDFTRHPEWSPQGNQIAYVSSRDGGGPLRAARLVRADGTGDRLLAVVPSGYAIQDLAWHPEGNHIWITASTPTFSEWRLWSVDLNTGTLRLLDDQFNLGYARFFGSSSRVIIEGDEIGADGLSHPTLYLTEQQTLQPRVRIFDAADDQWNPALSPDEDKVAYLRSAAHSARPHALEVVSLKDGTVRELVAPLPGLGSFHREGLSWQPRGRCVAGFDY